MGNDKRHWSTTLERQTDRKRILVGGMKWFYFSDNPPELDYSIYAKV